MSHVTKSILVTGCAGFIGSNFVKKFQKQFPRVAIAGIDDFSSGRRSLLPRGITFYEGSITDRKLVEKIFKKHRPEYVFHFAAMPRVSLSVEKPIETTEANVLGTAVLLKASVDHGVKRFIYSSSSSVYGGAKKLPTREHENDPSPKSPYALQKYTGELFCRMWSDLYGLDTVCLRYFNVFGPGQYGDSPYSTVVAAWLESLFMKKKGFLEGDGTQSRDFCFVENVVQANVKAMQFKGRFNGEAFNIGAGDRTNLREVKELIEKHTGRKLTIDRRAPRKGDVKHTHADIAKAKKWFGYAPAKRFEQGLKETIWWYEQLTKKSKK
jgi:UDP-glucose 4-epimerase